jgi:hypothetical protein
MSSARDRPTGRASNACLDEGRNRVATDVGFGLTRISPGTNRGTGDGGAFDVRKTSSEATEGSGGRVTHAEWTTSTPIRKRTCRPERSPDPVHPALPKAKNIVSELALVTHNVPSRENGVSDRVVHPIAMRESLLGMRCVGNDRRQASCPDMWCRSRRGKREALGRSMPRTASVAANRGAYSGDVDRAFRGSGSRSLALGAGSVVSTLSGTRGGVRQDEGTR